jgi:hypothetical protein
MRSNCGRRRGGGGRVREGYINTQARVREGYIELRQIPADPGKVIIKDSIYMFRTNPHDLTSGFATRDFVFYILQSILKMALDEWR